MILQTKE